MTGDAPLLRQIQRHRIKKSICVKSNGIASVWHYITGDKCRVGLVFVLFVLLRGLDRIFSKRVSDRMTNYNLMYYNVLWPIGVQLMQVMLCVAWVLYHRFHLKDKRYGLSFFLPGATIASACGAFPQIRLAMFSFWDQLNALVTGLPAPFIDLTSQGLMSNTVVIWTMIISFFYLGTRYRQEHYIGCVIIIISGLVAITVELQTNDPPLGTFKDSNGELKHSSAVWFVIYLLGTLPSGISNCYKQKCLKSVDLEVMYASLFAGWWQIFWGLVFFPVNWIRLPYPAEPNPPGETLDFLSRSITCFMGHVPTNSSGLPISSDAVCASPGGSAATWFVVYLLFNVSFNVLLLWLTKRMSGTWAQVATVLCLDIASFFSQFRFLMGDEASPLRLEQYLALVVAAIAMWVYNLQDEVDVEGGLVKGSVPVLPSQAASVSGTSQATSTGSPVPFPSPSPSPIPSPSLPSYHNTESCYGITTASTCSTTRTVMPLVMRTFGERHPPTATLERVTPDV